MTNSVQAHYLRALIRSIPVVIITSCAFRIFCLFSYPKLNEQFFLLIHGIINEAVFPLSLVAIAAFYRHESLSRFFLVLVWLQNIIISWDFFHFFRYGFRINSDLLIDQRWLAFIRSERPAFAGVIFGNILLFWIILKLSNSSKSLILPKPFPFLLTVVVMHFCILFRPAADLTRVVEWEQFIEAQEKILKTRLEISSHHSHFKLKLEEVFPDPIKCFAQSHFYELFASRFSGKPKPQLTFLNPEEKIWSHKGFHQSLPENTPEAGLMALSKNFSGLEIDVHFLLHQPGLVVSHDFPDKRKAVFLEIYLKSLAPYLPRLKGLWLDFKNLHQANIEKSLQFLNELSEKFPVRDRLLIESDDALLLRKVSQAGFRTILAIGYGNESFQITEAENFAIRSLIVLSNCEMVSLPWQTALKESTWECLKDFPVCFYTVNDPEVLKILAQKNQVYCILTDLETDPGSLIK
ncbi:MAG: hypothetical protein ACOYXC_09605 [Candidatus Rifleibacteriota bacterium]